MPKTSGPLPSERGYQAEDFSALPGINSVSACVGSIVSNGSRFRSGRDWHWDWDWNWRTLFTVDLVITYRWHHPLNHDHLVLFCSVSLFYLSRLDTDCIILKSNRVNSLSPLLTRTSQRLTCIRPRLDPFRTIITLLQLTATRRRRYTYIYARTPL
ncbi:hypothetical protein DER46DRAFT_374789 [Fusarium sp. MPI-SDFR-AT-0072]|nr:hypothetical protein DER46DRAFT_374789 [Fusarium sp. MPI-SDFR-AT-0072]